MCSPGNLAVTQMSEEPKSPPETKEAREAVVPRKDESAGEGSKLMCVKGDLFSCPATDSLAHCISEDCRMGVGIAVHFRKTFGGVKELLAQRECHNKGAETLSFGTLLHNPLILTTLSLLFCSHREKTRGMCCT
uniref:O-acyl-ADP-ribose deacylase 1 n=1 Tax=Electrophorus electricus TaxID=8005 RepID=A0A4W4ELJ7_ELEEL